MSPTTFAPTAAGIALPVPAAVGEAFVVGDAFVVAAAFAVVAALTGVRS